jgi:hypothetical protein
MLKVSITYCLVYSLRISAIAFLTAVARYITVSEGASELVI